MINGIEGIPGSGKSYEATVFHVLEHLKQGRLIVTNLPLLVDMFAAIDPSYRQLIELRRRALPIRGTWEAHRVDDQGNGNAFVLWSDMPDHVGELEKAPAVSVMPFGHVWDYYHAWRHPKTGRGPVFIIDECHVPLPSAKGGKTDIQVVEWFKLHRHFNCDVLLMTQSFRDMDQMIAGLLSMLVKCRKADFMGDANSYVRKVHAGYRGAVISTETRPYKPEYFPLYKSHTQGMSVAEVGAADVKPYLVKFRRMTRMVFVATACLAGYLVWSVVFKTDAKPEPKKPQIAAPGQKELNAKAQPVQTPVTAIQPEADADQDPEPYAGKGLHLRGEITFKGRTTHMLVVSQNGQAVAQLEDADLTRAGYKFKALGPCVAVVSWKKEARSVTCDLPAVNMVQAASKTS